MIGHSDFKITRRRSMIENLKKWKSLPLWAKIVVVIYICFIIYSIGEVDLFLW